MRQVAHWRTIFVHASPRGAAARSRNLPAETKAVTFGDAEMKSDLEEGQLGIVDARHVRMAFRLAAITTSSV
jgi:hypothetical protein